MSSVVVHKRAPADSQKLTAAGQVTSPLHPPSPRSLSPQTAELPNESESHPSSEQNNDEDVAATRVLGAAVGATVGRGVGVGFEVGILVGVREGAEVGAGAGDRVGEAVTVTVVTSWTVTGWIRAR